jgi:hypothetical protein
MKKKDLKKRDKNLGTFSHGIAFSQGQPDTENFNKISQLNCMSHSLILLWLNYFH